MNKPINERCNEIRNKIRPVTPEDEEKKLPEYSPSKFNTYKQCPMQYKLKYVAGKSTYDTSLSLELGKLLHYILEQKGKMILEGNGVRYDELEKILEDGARKGYKWLNGITKLKEAYPNDWDQCDKASGMNYDEKLSVFDKVLHSEMENDDWKLLSTEQGFRFVWEDRAIINGYADRIDEKDGQYRIIDYKTSKSPFDKSDPKALLQLGIYALAVLNDFGTLPKEAAYRYILLKETPPTPLPNGGEEAAAKEMDELIDTIENDKDFKPNPSPLCYWCNYCKLNPNAKKYKDACEYYSKWTRENKTDEVNKPWRES